MFTIYDIKREYIRLDAKTGMNIATSIPVKISNRFQTTRGRYRYTMSNSDGSTPYNESITISAFVMRENEPDFLGTIRHEYAHAMAARVYKKFGLGHGPEWQKCCEIVGCDPVAKREATEQQRTILDNRKKYIIACECGKKFIYHRKSKIVTMVENGNCETLSCPRCKSHNLHLEN